MQIYEVTHAYAFGPLIFCCRFSYVATFQTLHENAVSISRANWAVSLSLFIHCFEIDTHGDQYKSYTHSIQIWIDSAQLINLRISKYIYNGTHTHTANTEPITNRSHWPCILRNCLLEEARILMTITFDNIYLSSNCMVCFLSVSTNVTRVYHLSSSAVLCQRLFVINNFIVLCDVCLIARNHINHYCSNSFVAQLITKSSLSINWDKCFAGHSRHKITSAYEIWMGFPFFFF